MYRKVTYVIFLFFGKSMLKRNTCNKNIFKMHGATDSYSIAIVPKTVKYMPIWILLKECS